MDQKKFSAYDALRDACKIAIDNAFLLIIEACLVWIAAIIGSIIVASLIGGLGIGATYLIFGKSPVVNIVGAGLGVVLISLIFMLFIGMGLLFIGMGLGYYKIAFDIYDTGASSIRRLFSCMNLLLKGSFAMVLYVLIVAIGLGFLIVPGIYLYTRLGFYLMYIVDRKVGPMDALRSSWQLTAGNEWNILGFFLALLIISAIPILGFPLSAVATAVAYRHLERSTEPMVIERAQ